MTRGTPLQLDQDRQTKARHYARLQRRFWFAQLVLAGGYLLVWSLVGIGPLSDWMRSSGSPFSHMPWAFDLLAVALFIMGPYWVGTLPLDFHSGYRLPHRFGLSTQSFRGWITDQIKMVLIGAALGIPLLLGLYAIIRTVAQWWLLAGLAYSLVTVVLATLAPVLLMPLFFTLKPLMEDRPDLVERLTRLAQRNGAAIKGVYSIDMSRRTRTANAALTGLFGTRRVLLGDTLLDNFEDDQIEAVLAHELAHHVHHDIPLSILIQTAFNLGTFWLGATLLQSLALPLGLAGSNDPAGLPLLAVAFGLAGLLTMPLSNAYSRWREGLADDFALANIDEPQSFARAMAQLADQNLADANPDRWVVLLLYSHPPLADRIAKAADIQASK